MTHDDVGSYCSRDATIIVSKHTPYLPVPILKLSLNIARSIPMTPNGHGSVVLGQLRYRNRFKQWAHDLSGLEYLDLSPKNTSNGKRNNDLREVNILYSGVVW